MSVIAEMAIDLLCALTFQPEGGHDPEDLAQIEQSWWQTLLHDLSPEERHEAEKAIQKQIERIRSLPQESLPTHLQDQIAMLEAFMHGELD